MKLTALILATYISLLTVQPVFTMLASVYNNQSEVSCGDNCCKHEKQDNTPFKPEQNGMCNPFQSCSICFGYNISEPIFQLVTIQHVKVLRAIVKNNFTSGFCSDCFHPPEIV